MASGASLVWADRERRSRERSDEDPRGPTEDFFESLLFLMGEGKEGAIREGRLFDEYWLKAGGSIGHLGFNCPGGASGSCVYSLAGQNKQQKSSLTSQ